MRATQLRSTMLALSIMLCSTIFAQNEKITFKWKNKDVDKTHQISVETWPNYGCTVDWGDGTVNTYDDNGTYTSPSYATIQEYTVTITIINPNSHFTSFQTEGYSREGDLVITSLDVTEAHELKRLGCSLNRLTTLDISNNKKLTSLNCRNNQLETLDISNNPKLDDFECSQNQLKTLDISNNPEIYYLGCDNNELETLDISNNKKLGYLSCYNNQLKTLDTSNNKTLSTLSCYKNKLKALDFSNNPELYYLNCDNNEFETIDISNNKILKIFSCNNNKLKTLNSSNNTALMSLSCAFNELEILDLGNNKGLTSLSCNDNKLKTLDFSNNTGVTYLYCRNNPLKTLDVSMLPDLNNLECSKNELEILDISNNPKLTYLRCSENLLKILDVSNNNLITQIHCDNNLIEILNIDSDNTLSSVYCSNNKFSLSNLYDISKKIKESDSRILALGTQSLNTETVHVGKEIDLSDQAEFEEVTTDFVVKKGPQIATDKDYTFMDGKLIFQTVGDYTIEMSNTAIKSDYFSTIVTANYLVQIPTGIDENKALSLQVYPNPVTDKLYIESENSVKSIAIYNTDGRLLISTGYTNDGINVSSLPNGVYLLKTTSDIEQNMVKFIKK